MKRRSIRNRSPQLFVLAAHPYAQESGITRDDFGKADKARAFIGTRRVKRDGLDDRGWFD